ncbi:hypothetical protein WJX72_002997 [[Myrmecia] bisecta]|uniref:Secreted protein n=1 Tax=[Myrmecia] bisecta TaxID=41462 RepID=A0AAW1PX36_9CHLO
MGFGPHSAYKCWLHLCFCVAGTLMATAESHHIKGRGSAPAPEWLSNWQWEGGALASRRWNRPVRELA